MARRVGSEQLVLTGSAQSLGLGMGEQTSYVYIRSAAGNAAAYVGDSTVSASTGFLLQAGETLKMETNNPDHVYVVGTAADTLYVLGASVA